MFQSWSPRQASSTNVTLRRVLPAYISTYLLLSLRCRSFPHTMSSMFLCFRPFCFSFFLWFLHGQRLVNGGMHWDKEVPSMMPWWRTLLSGHHHTLFFLFWVYRQHPFSKKEMSIIFPELFRLILVVIATESNQIIRARAKWSMYNSGLLVWSKPRTGTDRRLPQNHFRMAKTGGLDSPLEGPEVSERREPLCPIGINGWLGAVK